jgi:hypothetical protein
MVMETPSSRISSAAAQQRTQRGRARSDARQHVMRPPRCASGGHVHRKQASKLALQVQGAAQPCSDGHEQAHTCIRQLPLDDDNAHTSTPRACDCMAPNPALRAAALLSTLLRNATNTTMRGSAGTVCRES